MGPLSRAGGTQHQTCCAQVGGCFGNINIWSGTETLESSFERSERVEGWNPWHGSPNMRGIVLNNKLTLVNGLYYRSEIIGFFGRFIITLWDIVRERFSPERWDCR